MGIKSYFFCEKNVYYDMKTLNIPRRKSEFYNGKIRNVFIFTKCEFYGVPLENRYQHHQEAAGELCEVAFQYRFHHISSIRT